MRRLSAAILLGFVGCSVGAGTGEVRGRVAVAACALNVPRYSMEPDFFGSDWHQGSLTIHVAKGGDTGDYNDEFVILVDDTSYIARHLNERVPVGATGITPVHATLRLTRSCGRTALAQAVADAALEAYDGYMVFEAVYRGDPNGDAAIRRTSVSEFSLRLRDPRVLRDITASGGGRAVGEGREPALLSGGTAELEGRFEFFFTRGRPAQRFP
jgi:hypothetical protein